MTLWIAFLWLLNDDDDAFISQLNLKLTEMEVKEEFIIIIYSNSCSVSSVATSFLIWNDGIILIDLSLNQLSIVRWVSTLIKVKKILIRGPKKGDKISDRISGSHVLTVG